MALLISGVSKDKNLDKAVVDALEQAVIHAVEVFDATSDLEAYYNETDEIELFQFRTG